MTFSRFDHECMATALRLARLGLFTAQPNPRVGCVIARDQQIVGQGWHRVTGGAHAEVEALKDAGKSAEGSTVYVTLEPCNHQGRTAPCVDALINVAVKRVVIACNDPNPLVNGSGVERLRAAGISVESGLMELQARELNPGFFKRMQEGLPWVRVKAAISLDGRTALESGASKWISSAESRHDVQRWRARSSAILTGIGTVLADNPNMNVRLPDVTGQPLKVIADSRWRTPPGSRILSKPGSALIFGDAALKIPSGLIDQGASCEPLDLQNGKLPLRSVLGVLAKLEINEVQVEAGATLCGALLGAGLVDEILLYQAPVLLGNGGAGPFSFGPLESMQDRTHLTVLETIHLGMDTRIRLRPE